LKIVRLLTLYILGFFVGTLSSSLRADDIVLLNTAEEAAMGRLALIQQETKEIRASYYILNDDSTGRVFLAMLKDAAARGVKVKLLVDAFGARNFTPSTLYAALQTQDEAKAIIHSLIESGVEIKVYHPPIWYKPFQLLVHNFRRMHDKLLITSGHFITGDRNIADEYFDRVRFKSTKTNFVSRDILSRGDAADKASDYFDKVWTSKHVQDHVPDSIAPEKIATATRNLKRYASQIKKSKLWVEKIPKWKDKIKESVKVSFISDQLDSGLFGKTQVNGSKEQVLQLINSAQSRIEIVNPYVVLTKDMRKALYDAKQRGVHVSIITNSIQGGDNTLVSLAFDDEAHELIKNGIDVYGYENSHINALHSKTITIDEREAYIGSYNLDPRSETLNLEVGVRVQDPDTVRSLSEDFEKLKTHSKIWNTANPPNKACHVLMKYLIAPLLRDQL